ncbi:argininosuccinate synthase [Vulcanisaeta distributa]|uniref:argininosuccinate synthase domain-containing protein n=1 Tax=Vulcanisaeta distributa TaxID=164451 RepID=UPI000B0CD92F|nr:argininosuccinate synthase domain-containing protein [Vulcanisaeta distributa]
MVEEYRGRETDDPGVEVPEDAFKWTVSPEKVSEPLILEVEFREGLPVAVNGERMGMVGIISLLNKVVGAHGFGRLIISRIGLLDLNQGRSMRPPRLH